MDSNADHRPETPVTDGGSPVPVGVKIGSTRTVIAFPAPDGSGLQVVQTLTCLAEYQNPITGETKYAYGDDAAAEYPEAVKFPLRAGLPDAGRQTELTSQFFDAVVESHDVPENSAVVYVTPISDDQSGQTNLRRVIEESPIGGAGIERYPEMLCGAIPAVGDGLEAVERVFTAMNLGATHVEAAAFRRGEQVAPYRSGSVTGNEVDRKIISNVENETQSRVHIDINTAREYKEQHGNFENFEPVTDVIQQPGGGRHEFTIERSIMAPLEEYLDSIVAAFVGEFLSQLSSSHHRVYRLALDQPVVLTGGMACLPGLVEAFEQRVNEAVDDELPVIAPERPAIAATIGAHRIATRLSS
ncbi:cell division protein FtsA [Halovenus sp. HT40]|uniref:cell division protein FtsA n=1 Tax=Halovenus sp. HT40 TaxID=3126691 RepID=UPI00300E7A6F